jgi:hypothetical protein
VFVAFLVGAWVLVRKELAPKRRARAQGGRMQADAAADEREREHADHEQGAS